jgi:hypothetical protein
MGRFHLSRFADTRIEKARREGRGLAYRISKVSARRWNWVLKVHYVRTDPATGLDYEEKILLRTSDERDVLERIREQLEAAERQLHEPEQS